MEQVDCIVVGAGVVGLAIGRRLALAGLETLVLEREKVPGSQISSRNSEVIHAGIYYPPGSLKARLCVLGRQQLYRYCAARGVAHANCGKLIVAANDQELRVLDKYVDTARRNGVTDLQWKTPDEVRVLEPAVQCTAALWSPSTGIIDSHEFMHALQGDIEANDGMVVCDAAVSNVRLGSERHQVEVLQGHVPSRFETRLLINAAGLGAHALAARFAGLDAAEVPPLYLCKGHYYTLGGCKVFRHLVYPVGGTAGLGIHVTLDMSGAVRFGPDVEWIETEEYSFDNARRDAFVAAIRRYYPELDETRLQPGYTGIRPKLVGPEAAPADFLIQGPRLHGVGGLVNLYGIESPGLTASLAIADEVAAQLGLGLAVDGT